MQNDFFDAPPEGATPHGFERALQIQYGSGKVEENFLKYATDEYLQENVEKSKVGFSYYDKELKQRVSMAALSFVALEIYVGLSGFDGEDVNYWSSRSRDTRKEPLTVWASNASAPILSGLYVGKKHKDDVSTVGGKPVPPAAKFKPFIKAYCLELDRVIEIEVSAICQTGLKKAIASADGKPDNWSKIFLLGLASNDHLWGFRLSGYAKVQKDGSPHTGKGNMFYEPIFQAGVVNPTLRPELHAKCVALQNEERAMHAAYLDRNAQYQRQAPAADAGPTQASAPQYTDRPISSTTASPAASRMEPAVFDVPTAPANPAMAAPMPDDDDLPF